MRLSFAIVVGCLLWVSAAAAESWADMLGLTAPVTVLSCGSCLDGGSVKGTLVDANGLYYAFFVDHAARMVSLVEDPESTNADTGAVGKARTPEGGWYVGADYNTGKAELLAPTDRRIVAIRMLLWDWLDRVASPDEQAHLRTIDARHVPRDSCGVTSKTYATKWFVANSRGTLR